MSKAPPFLLLLCLSLFSIPSLSSDRHHKCIHNQINFEPDYITLPPSPEPEGRALQTYQNIRIYFDYSTLTGTTDTFRNYISNIIIPPSKNYFEAALKVKPSASNLVTSLTQMCSDTVIVPSTHRAEGVPADLVIFLTQTNQPSESFLAFAGPCTLDITTSRPLFGRLNFNSAYLTPTTKDVQIEKDISVVMHEITHVLGFTSTLYASYINPSTNQTLKGHYFNKTVNGITTLVLNLEPLTTRLKAHFNCQTLQGAYIENEGGIGSAGSHFERRVFYNEYMTASSIKDQRITEFSLALLEGTGWYKVDYSLAEPITYGKNQGCEFLDATCVNPSNKVPRFQEFCSSLTGMGCSWTQRGGAVCGADMLGTWGSLPASFNYWGNNTVVDDIFADNCPTYQMYSNLDCEDTDSQVNATLTAESYGYGSKCFTGTLYPTGSLLEPYAYCFKPTCTVQSDGSYRLQVKIGDNNVLCNSQSLVTVPGFRGSLQCPDPNKFCAQIINEGFCKRRCSGRGSCVNMVCQCSDGWGFHDCSRKAYKDNCARCAGIDSLKTSCYGDSCECNPSNTTCMCQLGLLTGTVCSSTPISNTNASVTTDPISNTGTNSGLSGNTGGSGTDGAKTDNKTSTASEEDFDKSLVIGIAAGGATLTVGGIIALLKYGKAILKSLKASFAKKAAATSQQNTGRNPGYPMSNPNQPTKPPNTGHPMTAI